MTNVTIITPCAPAHVRFLQRCIASVQGLNAPVLHLIGIDRHKRGAGAVRNALLAKVTTPYVVFLDADDTIEPNYLDETLPMIAPKSYVYTGWREGMVIKYPAEPSVIWNTRINAPTYHLVTCLFNTQDLIDAGGFDESLNGLEDKDLFLRLITMYCICPVRVNKPLMQYRYEQGQYSRAHEVYNTGERHTIDNLIIERYGHKMSCCNVSSLGNIEIGTRLDGDVLAEPLWGGNRMYYGKATGRKYGRLSRSKNFWASPADVSADRELRMVAESPFTPTEFIADDYGVEIIDPDVMASLTSDQVMALGFGFTPDLNPVPVAKADVSHAKPKPSEIANRRRKK